MSKRPDDFVLRPARAGDGAALHMVTWSSVRSLAAGHYSAHQLDIWMGSRMADWHERLIMTGQTIVAERSGKIEGFVHTLPGEINRLFLLPEASGRGLGRRLLELGLSHARQGHPGPIRLVALLNAVTFYEHFGFRSVERGYYPPEVADGAAEMVKMEL